MHRIPQINPSQVNTELQVKHMKKIQPTTPFSQRIAILSSTPCSPGGIRRKSSRPWSRAFVGNGQWSEAVIRSVPLLTQRKYIVKNNSRTRIRCLFQQIVQLTESF
jgi:hypothetical protein